MFIEEPKSRIRIPGEKGSLLDMIRALECEPINPAFARSGLPQLANTAPHTTAWVISTPANTSATEAYEELKKERLLEGPCQGTFVDLLKYGLLRPEAITSKAIIAFGTTIRSEGEDKNPCLYKIKEETYLDLWGFRPKDCNAVRFLIAA